MKSFWYLMWKMFCHSDGVNSIKTQFQTCNLWTGWYVSYKSVNLFWLNLPHLNGKTFFTSNVKNFSHIFCYSDFCHYTNSGLIKIDTSGNIILFNMLVYFFNCDESLRNTWVRDTSWKSKTLPADFMNG